MTLYKEPIILALYIAHDDIIACFDYAQRTGVPNYQNTTNIFRVKSGGTRSHLPEPEDAVRRCVRVFSLLSRSLNIICVVLGVPSPISTFDQQDTDYGMLGDVEHDAVWANVNVVRLFGEQLTLSGFINLPKVIICSHQGAFAFGEYYARYHKYNPISNDTIEHDDHARKNTLLFLNFDATIDCAVVYRGRIYRSSSIPQIDHFFVSPHSLDVARSSSCKFHSNPSCVTGLASLPSLSQRWGLSAEQFVCAPPNSRVLYVVSAYIAQIALNLSLLFCPTQIVIAGRLVMNVNTLPLIRMHIRNWTSINKPAPSYRSYHSVHNLGPFIDTPLHRNSGVRGLLYVGNLWVRPEGPNVKLLREW